MSSNRGREESDWFLILSQTGEHTWLSFVPETQCSPGDGSLSSHLAEAEAGHAAARGTKAGKLQRHFTNQALDFSRNGRKGPHLPNTHTCAHPLLTPCLSEQPEKAACYRQTSTVKNKARKRQSDQNKQFGNKANVAVMQRTSPGSKQHISLTKGPAKKMKLLSK